MYIEVKLNVFDLEKYIKFFVCFFNVIYCIIINFIVCVLYIVYKII